MKAKICGKEFELPEGIQLKGGVGNLRRESIGSKRSREQSQASETPAHAGKERALPVRSMPVIGEAPSAHSELYGWPKRADKWNFAYAQELDARKKAGDILEWWYEPHAWRIAEGVSHKADFMVHRESCGCPIIEIHEVKGYSRNLRDGITRFKVARDKYRCFVWRMMKREKGRFVEVTP